MARDLRPYLEDKLDAGVPLRQIHQEIAELSIPEEDKDALWIWAHAYAELRPVSIFRRRKQLTNVRASHTPVVN